MNGITAKILSKELKELEMNKIISRTVIDNAPNGVEYSVTIYCNSLKKIVDGLKEWGDHHRALIFKRAVPYIETEMPTINNSTVLQTITEAPVNKT